MVNNLYKDYQLGKLFQLNYPSDTCRRNSLPIELMGTLFHVLRASSISQNPKNSSQQNFSMNLKLIKKISNPNIALFYVEAKERYKLFIVPQYLHNNNEQGQDIKKEAACRTTAICNMVGSSNIIIRPKPKHIPISNLQHTIRPSRQSTEEVDRH